PTAADHEAAGRAAGEAARWAGGRGLTPEQEYRVAQAARTAAEQTYQAAGFLIEPVAAARGTLAALRRLSRVPGLAELLEGAPAADRDEAAEAVVSLIVTANVPVTDTVPLEAAWLLAESRIDWPDGYLMPTVERNALSVAYQAAYASTRPETASRPDIVIAAEVEAKEAADREIARLRGPAPAQPGPAAEVHDPEGRGNGLVAGRLAYLAALSGALVSIQEPALAESDKAPVPGQQSLLARLMTEAESRRWAGDRLAAARDATDIAQQSARHAGTEAQRAETALARANAALRHATEAHGSARATLERTQEAQQAAAEDVEAEAREHDAAVRSAAQPPARPRWIRHLAPTRSGEAAVRVAEVAYTAAITAHVQATQAVRAARDAVSVAAAAERAAAQAQRTRQASADQAEAAERAAREVAEAARASLERVGYPLPHDGLSVADTAAMDVLVSHVLAAHAGLGEGAPPTSARSSTGAAMAQFVARMRAVADARDGLPADDLRASYLAARNAAAGGTATAQADRPPSTGDLAEVAASDTTGSPTVNEARHTAEKVLPEATDAARAAVQAPAAPVGALLATATPEVEQRWRLAARARAEFARTAAEGAADRASGLTHWREFVMFTAFPLLAGARGWIPGQLGRPDYLALVQRVLGPHPTQVSAADLTRIDGYIQDLLDAGRPVSIDGIVRRHGFMELQDRLEPATAATGPEALAQREAAAVDAVVGPPAGSPMATTERNWEVRGLLRSLNEQDQALGDHTLSDRAKVLDHLVGRVYQRYPRRYHGAALVEPVGLEQIGQLVTDKIGPSAALTWINLRRVYDTDAARRRWLTSTVVGQAVSAGRRLTGKPALARRLRRRSVHGWMAQWQLRQVQRAAGMPDAREQVRAEVRQVWDYIRTVPGSEPSLGSLTEADVARLVAARRELFAEVGNRQFTDWSDYRAMTLLALGTPEVTARGLGQLAARLRNALTTAHAADGPLPLLRAHVRRVRPQSGTSPSRSTLAAAMAQLVIQDWSAERVGARPSVPGITTDHSQLVSAFHTIVHMPFTAELTAWLNGIVPLSRHAISEDTVRRKLFSLFGQALDDGVDLQVQAGGRTFAVRLWPVPVAPPSVPDSSLIAAGEPGSGQFPGKGENRIYPYDEAANTETVSTGLFGDGGFVGQAGAGSTKLVGAFTGGYGRYSGRRMLASMQKAVYQFLRIKEPQGAVDLRTAWVARVLDIGTNRWREFIWSDPHGKPVEETLTYAVARFA
ncbi:MAG TPA: hypothetical protein VJT31_28830, partial [Rugosimonospora sp.]|nr:hypothetical protein [Rugosimonospora sp.]